MACLETAIGLSRTPCNCLEDTPDNYDTSDSGYFMDELPGFEIGAIGGAADCAKGGLWDIMELARQTAIKDLKADLLVQLGTNYKKSIETMSYTIGSVKYTGVYNPGTFYAGVRIVPKQIRNGLIKLSTIKLLFDTTITVQCSLFNNLTDTPLHTFSVNCTANRASESAALNYELPMFISGEYVEYFLVYELPVSARPLQNKINCSSCSGWTITCCETPCFGNRHNKSEQWNNSIMIGGIKGNTWTELDEQTGSANQNNGIILNIVTGCDYEDIICNNLDYGTGNQVNATGLTIAKALLYKADANAYDWVLSSQNVSRGVMTDKEGMTNKKNEWKSEYNTRVAWLAQNMDITNNGCYFCEPRMFKGGILV